ncbi:uncharacterized protein DSM5745_01018 [Aspergillus mulundensis]|uniref:Uncharacterized protein n=1 Tax=Aspergillus mulundensis TaxID=1810919 RepID=A0A3D8T556_9EURO|nr:hypothetical protein DSM5745_01018 [Aspergillus mulundensis]RDW93696.1 hypothetical protein DSM5745_01018 [Aspergillus mulundensis]
MWYAPPLYGGPKPKPKPKSNLFDPSNPRAKGQKAQYNTHRLGKLHKGFRAALLRPHLRAPGQLVRRYCNRGAVPVPLPIPGPDNAHPNYPRQAPSPPAPSPLLQMHKEAAFIDHVQRVAADHPGGMNGIRIRKLQIHESQRPAEYDARRIWRYAAVPRMACRRSAFGEKGVRCCDGAEERQYCGLGTARRGYRVCV